MKATLALILMTLISSNLVIAREEIVLPTITKPAALQEGTERNLTDAQIAELLPWAKDSKMFLIDLLDSMQGLSTQDKIERLDYGIKQVVGESAPKHSELLMRYVLNRAIVIKDTLADEMDANAVGTEDTKLRTLVASINMAVRYYDIDMNTLSKKSIPDFQVFGEEYFNFLSELNKSIFDASAQYAIQRTSFEWLQWDLYRDLNNARHAPKIVKINNALKMAPLSKMSDAQYIKNIQQLKRVAAQLTLLQTPNPIVGGNSSVENNSNASNGGKFGYSSSASACYKKSANGSLMYSSPVSDTYCASGKYHYSSSGSACYKKSVAGDVMYSSPVSDTYCASGAYHYSSSGSACYKKSTAGDVMYSSPVSDTYCASGKYHYSTSSSACYKKSIAGDVMYSSPVNDSYCQ